MYKCPNCKQVKSKRPSELCPECKQEAQTLDQKVEEATAEEIQAQQKQAVRA